MKLRTLLAPALLGAVALAAHAPAAVADAPPGGSASDRETFERGNAPADVDIVAAHVHKTTSDYRATVTYAGLRARPATRWFYEFTEADASHAGQRAAEGSEPRLNIVELRVNPDGKASSFGWKVTQDPDDPPARSTCSAPQRAVADYAADTITFIVPRRCWKPTTGVAYATAYAVEQTRDTWDGSVLPDLDRGEADLETFTWTYRAP